MKKILIALLFLFNIGFIYAETCDFSKVNITSIELVNSTDSVDEFNDFDGLDLYFGALMENLGDYVRYKVAVKNDSTEKVELAAKNIDNDYIKYEFEFPDNSKVIDANSTKEFYLTATYKNEVPLSEFHDKEFEISRVTPVDLVTGDAITNPKTGVRSYVLSLTLVLILSAVAFLALRKKGYTLVVLLVGLSIIIPMHVYSSCKGELKIDSSVIITNNNYVYSFANDSWEAIARNIAENNTSYYNIGDTKTIEMEEYGNHTVRLINKSNDGICTTNSSAATTACGFVVEFADIITTHRMNPYTDGSSDGDGAKGSWKYSEMRAFLNEDIYNALPNDLRHVIRPTQVVTGHGSNDLGDFVTEDNLFLLSWRELWNYDGQGDSAVQYTRQEEYYRDIGVSMTSYSGAIKQYNGENYFWWLRTPNAGEGNGFSLVKPTGDGKNEVSSSVYGVSPAFRITIN